MYITTSYNINWEFEKRKMKVTDLSEAINEARKFVWFSKWWDEKNKLKYWENVLGALLDAKRKRNAWRLKIEITKHFNETDESVWLYEKRGWRTVFLYNIYISDIVTIYDLDMLNEPHIWKYKTI